MTIGLITSTVMVVMAMLMLNRHALEVCEVNEKGSRENECFMVNRNIEWEAAVEVICGREHLLKDTTPLFANLTNMTTVAASGYRKLDILSHVATSSRTARSI